MSATASPAVERGFAFPVRATIQALYWFFTIEGVVEV
jgi:hypothetical protein